MIIDALAKSKQYAQPNTELRRALEFLAGDGVAALADGRHPIGGSGTYVKIERYRTEPREARRAETHDAFVDIQVLLEGTEIIEWALRDILTVTQPYNPDTDLCFYDGPVGASLVLSPGTFVVFFPWDAHRPNCETSPGGDAVRKAVVKIPIGLV